MSENVARDEEGLLSKYDVVICGTGLIQSILASALTRAGKSVLHCDAEGYYGELDAVLTLPYINHGEVWQDHTPHGGATEVLPGRLSLSRPCLKLRSTHTLTNVSLQVGTPVETQYGAGVVQELGATKVVIALNTWKLANGSSPSLHVSIPDLDSLDETLESYLACNCHVRPTLLAQAEKLLQQSARSFAIDVTPTLIFGSGTAVSGFLTSNVSEYVEFKPIEGMLWFDGEGNLSRVPCSKGDVFNTKLLNPLEKRKLMKFLQLVMDFTISEQSSVEEETSVAEEVHSLNERALNQGRSLSRPQNKAVKTGDLEILREAIEANEIDFETYLAETQKLSPPLKLLVRHALALETTSVSVSIGDGMRRLSQHLQGLGKFGKTAFLVPMYGSGEFPQAFCRSAAVHGGTYLLRRRPMSVECTDGHVTGVVISGPVEGSEHKTVLCNHVVVPVNTTQTIASKQILRRVSIISGNIVHEGGAQRHIILIPPNSTLGNKNAIHGIVLDHSAKVVPPNCTLLHLTTMLHGDDDDSFLERAAIALLPADSVELYHVLFSYDLFDDTTSEFCTGLHVCRQTGQTLASDDAFVVAKNVFAQICPDIAFLTLSEKMENTIKQNLAGREEADEERDVLDKAAELFQKTNVDLGNE